MIMIEIQLRVDSKGSMNPGNDRPLISLHKLLKLLFNILGKLKLMHYHIITYHKIL